MDEQCCERDHDHDGNCDRHPNGRSALTPVDYDTVEGIDRSVRTLADLHALRKERVAAGYDRKEQLHQFILLGRFWMDSCGNFMACTFKHYDGHKVNDTDWLPDALPRVVTYDAVALFGGLQVSGNCDTWLPSPTNTCDECGDRWTLETCHDAIMLGRDAQRRFRHTYCHRVALMRDEFRKFIDILAIAGIAMCPLVPIPNEYWGNDEVVGPWFLIRTPRGDIKIGWRKRVINIDWKDIVERKIAAVKRAADLSDYDKKRAIHEACGAALLFPEVTNTKGDFYVHAYGGEEAAEFLTRMAKFFRIGAHI